MTDGVVVGVLRGGPQSCATSHAQALKSGQAALRALQHDNYHVRDIYIDQDGVWHERGRQTHPGAVLPTLDVALVLTSGPYAASGALQATLERFGVPYSGSRSLESFEASHGVLAREHAKKLGLRTPRYRHADSSQNASGEAAEAARTFLSPLIVRPSRAHSDSYAQTLSGYQPVHQAVTGILAQDHGGAVIEERVRGPRVRVGVIENLRDQHRYVLPVEVLEDPFAPINGNHTRTAPTHVDQALRHEAAARAVQLHDALRLRHHSSSTFAVTPRGLVFLATDPFPHMGEGSAFCASCGAVGVTPGELFPHLVALALRDKNR